MAAFDFPSSPSVNQTYTANGVTWKWNGTMWMRVSGAGYLEKIEEGNSKIEVDDSGSGNVTITTDGTERFRVTSAGLVGIGTDDPESGVKLHLHDTSACRIQLTTDSTGFSSSDGTRLMVDSSNNFEILNREAANIEFFTNNTERFVIDSDGRLSAGGASAATNAWSGGDDLVIGSATSGKRTGITLVSGDDADGGIYWSDGTGANVYRGQLAYNHASDTMTFYTAASSKLSIDTNGHMRLSSGDLRVGDNTDSNAGSQTISVGSVSSGSGGIGIFANPTNGNSWVQFGDGTSGSDQYRGYMNYQHADDSLRFGTAASERLRVDSAGRAMIGQTSAYSATGTGNMMLTVTKSTTSRTDVAISNQSSGDNASAALVLATHGQDYILEATGSGNTTDGTRAFRILKGTEERLRIDTSGNKYTNTGAIGHGSGDYTNFANAGRTSNNNISIRAGNPSGGTTPANSSTAIKIYPAGVRSQTTGNLTGGIAWQHLDPDNGGWDSAYGAGAQIWMGAAFHDNPGQERDRFNLWMNSQIAGNSQPNQLAIEAYPNGVVRHPKVPSFMVRNSTSNNAFAANARATWDTSILNNGSHFDMTNNVFTAPIDGIYTFNCMMLSNANTRLFHNFRVNNTIIDGTRSEGHAVSGSYATCTITMTYSLSASDYVDVYVRNNNAYGGVYTNFNGYLVG